MMHIQALPDRRISAWSIAKFKPKATTLPELLITRYLVPNKLRGSAFHDASGGLTFRHRVL
jgi:hypothetical protein